MPRIRSASPNRLTRDAAKIVSLALALHSSGSRVEDTYWENLLATALTKLMRTGSDSVIDAAIDHLSKTNLGGYEVLVEQCETLSESCVLEKDGQEYDVLLVVAPLVAWTRYSIPTVSLAQKDLDAITVLLREHVLADGTEIGLLSKLASLDQMPRTFSETWQWMHRLGCQAIGLSSMRPDLNREPEGVNMLADTRYVVMAVSAPKGNALFRWQEEPGELGEGRAACLEKWSTGTQDLFNRLLPGCGLEVLIPDAFYVSNREADRRVRPLSLKAAVAWLGGALSLEPRALRAVIAGCGEQQVDEYRIGFTQKNENEVIYGCLWPLYGREEEINDPSDVPQPSTEEQIIAVLNECGVQDIRKLPGLLTPEFCEDCGAPFFPNPLGEMVHAELPEDAETAPQHFH